MNQAEKRKYDSVFNKFNNIESDKELRRQGLTLSDYDALYEVFRDLHNDTTAETLSGSVVRWCKKNGLIAVSHGIGWEISLF